MNCLRLALLLLFTRMALAQEPLARCLTSRYDYLISRNAQRRSQCSVCKCDESGCHTQCKDACEMCNADSSSCLVYTEKRHFYPTSTHIESCLRATAGLDAERTLCGGMLLTNKNEDMTLDGLVCHTPRLCGASPLDPRTVYNCTNVDGESLIDECNQVYEGFLGRVWQRYGSVIEYKTAGRCIFNDAVAASPEEEDFVSDDKDDSEEGLGAGAIIGIALGGFVVVTFALWAYYRPASRDNNTAAEEDSSAVDPEEQKPTVENDGSEDTEKQNSELSVDESAPQ